MGQAKLLSLARPMTNARFPSAIPIASTIPFAVAGYPGGD
jgi:hypothetical protein